ncbi:hypothetical protein [Cysteiniphilum halobium]|uniref:hypothetical protein n=1 Tax=Cysteiniphilum halobium TaxID=2219059 RepID=UPI000E655E1E|nr:hypothetical protein [Cysteiniphilum halobium]
MDKQEKQTLQSNKKPSSGKQTVAILVLLILAGILLYMAFIFFAKFQAYKKISENLKIELQYNYNQYLTLNHTTVNNVIHMNNYDYAQTIKALGGVFGNIQCTTKYSCEINGIVYQFDVKQHNNTLRIAGYHANLSKETAKAAGNSFVVAQTYSQFF